MVLSYCQPGAVRFQAITKSGIMHHIALNVCLVRDASNGHEIFPAFAREWEPKYVNVSGNLVLKFVLIALHQH